MVTIFFLVHHRSEYPLSYTMPELWVTSIGVVNLMSLLPGCSSAYRPLPCCPQVAVDCGIFRGFRVDHVELFKCKSLGHLFFGVCMYLEVDNSRLPALIEVVVLVVVVLKHYRGDHVL